VAQQQKKPVEVEEPPTPKVHAPAGGVQDLNIAVEPDPLLSYVQGDEIERVLTDEVHVDMGRGPLTFKPGDTITIKDGSIRRVRTSEGDEFEFKPSHVVYSEQRKAAIERENAASAATPPPEPPPEPEPPPPPAAKKEEPPAATKGGK